MNTIAKLRKLRDTLKADGIEDVVCLCSKYRQEAEEFDKLDDVLVGNVLQHQVTLTTTTLYNGVDMKDRALKYIVSELWNPLRSLAANVPWMRGIPARYICCITPKNVWKENLKNREVSAGTGQGISKMV